MALAQPVEPISRRLETIKDDVLGYLRGSAVADQLNANRVRSTVVSCEDWDRIHAVVRSEHHSLEARMLTHEFEILWPGIAGTQKAPEELTAITERLPISGGTSDACDEGCAQSSSAHEEELFSQLEGIKTRCSPTSAGKPLPISVMPRFKILTILV